IGYLISHMHFFLFPFFFYRPPQRVCPPFLLFFYLLTQRLAPSYFFFARPTQRVGLLYYSQMDLIGFCHSPSHMLGKYFLRCWTLTATGNLTPSNSSSMYAFPGKT